MKLVLRHILLTLLMLAFIQLPAAAGQSMPNVVTKWNGHNLSLTLPESFVATEESDKEIVFADETGQFSLCLREVNHNEYASLGASQIEGILCSHLCKQKYISKTVTPKHAKPPTSAFVRYSLPIRQFRISYLLRLPYWRKTLVYCTD